MAMVRASIVLVFVSMAQATAALAAPASTRAAGDAAIVIVKLDAAPSLITANVKNQSASSLFITLGEQSGGGIVAREESLWDDPSLAGANFSAEWDKTALWDALREACETTNL